MDANPFARSEAGDPFKGPAKGEGIGEANLKADRLDARFGPSEHSLSESNPLSQDELAEGNSGLRVVERGQVVRRHVDSLGDVGQSQRLGRVRPDEIGHLAHQLRSSVKRSLSALEHLAVKLEGYRKHGFPERLEAGALANSPSGKLP